MRLETVTFPSLHQPLLKIDVSKRRWLNQLKAPDFDRNDITGFVFDQDYSDRAFSYQLVCKQDENKKRQWETDKDFEALRRKLKLPMQSFKGQEIALGQANTENCKVVLTYRNGLQDSSKKHGIKVGVPEIDKLEAFVAIAKILAPVGLHPFEGYSPVQSGHTLDDTESRTINLPTLISAILETLETDQCLNFTPKSIDELNDTQLNQLLIQHFNIGLGQIQGERKAFQFNDSKSLDQTDNLQCLIQANREAMRRLYPNEQLLLVVFYEEQLQTEMKLLRAIIRVLWGEAVELLVNRLPANTHGSRESLPGKQLKAKERSQQRLDIWKSITKQIEARKQRTFCLVMAREFYPDPSGQKTAKPDALVNKPSTRQALAAMAGSCVQFILPIGTTQKKLLNLENFFHRAQSALKDLLSAHSGRVDDVQEKVNKWLKDIPPEAT